jgi:hypothetical protein
MYSSTYSVHKNKFRTNIPNLRKLLETTNIDVDAALDHYVEMVNGILNKYKTVVAIVDTQSVSLDDTKHIWFMLKLISRLQDKFKDVTEAIYIKNATPIFKVIYGSVKHVIMPVILAKIHME